MVRCRGRLLCRQGPGSLEDPRRAGMYVCLVTKMLQLLEDLFFPAAPWSFYWGENASHTKLRLSHFSVHSSVRAHRCVNVTTRRPQTLFVLQQRLCPPQHYLPLPSVPGTCHCPFCLQPRLHFQTVFYLEAAQPWTGGDRQNLGQLCGDVHSVLILNSTPSSAGGPRADQWPLKQLVELWELLPQARGAGVEGRRGQATHTLTTHAASVQTAGTLT